MGKRTPKLTNKEKKVFIHAIDKMFCAMQNIQVFTAFGIDKSLMRV